ncbi:MAG TPA: hypothetical protein VF664_08655, partial [Cystobacter sp.]
PGCHKRSDMREAVRHLNFGGQPEALFGLQIWTGMLEWPASDVPRIEVVDVRKDVPYDGEIVYAIVTPQSAHEIRSANDWLGLIAPQASHQPWSLVMSFYVPAGPPQKAGLLFVVKPSAPMPLPRELALQAL